VNGIPVNGLRADEAAVLQSRLWLFGLLLVCAYLVLSLWNIQIQTIAAPDEPRYAVAAREMLRTGDWVVPKFNAQPRLVKPIFFYWVLAAVGAVGQALGAPLDTAFRFGPLLMGLLAILGTFVLGARLRGERLGFVAAGILMTSFEFHKLSRELVCDMSLATFLLWSWVFFHIAIRRIERGAAASSTWGSLLGFYVCLGMACMTKGPFLVGIFSVVPLLAYLAWTKKLRLLARAGLLWGVPISLVLGFWWFAALRSRGYDWVAFFVTENLQRFKGAKDHTQNPLPFVFYFKSLGENFAPWIVLVPVAAWWSLKSIGVVPSSTPAEPRCSVKDSFMSLSDSSKMLFCCLAIPFFIMGISVSKRPLYLLPIYPYIALWVSWLLDATFLQKEGTSFCVRCANTLGALLAILFGGLAIAVHKAPSHWPEFKPLPSELTMLSVLLGVLAVFGIAASQNLKVGRRFNFMVQILSMAAALVIGYEAVVVPIRERDADRMAFFSALRERIGDRAVVTFEDSATEAVWYLDRPNQEIKQLRRPDLKQWFASSPGPLLLAPKDEPKKHLDPKFLESLHILSPGIPRGEITYILAEPDAQHPPDPEIFKPLPGHGHNQTDDLGED
jgi:4-amino-4-deoxy-L-arabinose transferase-like glycosyltransferase